MLSTVFYLNHGRWICECPFPGCYGAFAEDKMPPDQVCTFCGNQFAVEALLTPHMKKLIERVVASRPVENQNWVPGETLGVLVSENIEHGVDNP